VKQSGKLYPLMLSRVFVEKIWGSKSIGWALGREDENLPSIGELWETFDGENGSVVINGAYRTRSLSDLSNDLGEQLLGTRLSRYTDRSFPLLIKYLFPTQTLSVQVHPGDEYALVHENSYGKEEMWVVLSSDPESFIVVGWKEPMSKETIVDRIANNRLDGLMNVIRPKVDDVYYIPAGTIHALGPGTAVLEIQQNSNVTYRIHDWDRTDQSGKLRELHTAKAIEVLNFSYCPQYRITPLTVESGENEFKHLCACNHFAAVMWILKQPLEFASDQAAFWVLNVISGQGAISSPDMDPLPLNQGTTVLIPAKMGAFVIEPSGPLRIVKSWVPDLRKDIIMPLRSAGFSDDEIAGLAGFGQKNHLRDLF